MSMNILLLLSAVCGGRGESDYVRPLKAFGFKAADLDAMENAIVEKEDYVPPGWCRLWKTGNDHSEESAIAIPCKPALFAANTSNIISAKIRQLSSETGCGHDIQIVTMYGDDEGNQPPTVVVAHRGKCTFIEKAKNAQKAGADALVIVDNNADQNTKLMLLVGQGDDTNTTLPIPVVSVYAKEKELLSMHGHYMSIQYGLGRSWQDEETLYFWKELVKAHPHNPKFKMRYAKNLWKLTGSDGEAEAMFRMAIDDCLPKDPRAIYAYFYLGRLLVERRTVDAWREAATFLRGYKRYFRQLATTMTKSIIDGSMPTKYIAAIDIARGVIENGLRISGGKDGSEPLLRLAHAQLEEHLTGNKTQAWTNYVKAREMSFAYNEEVAFQTAEAALHRLAEEMKSAGKGVNDL
jgi:hypothetical protein